MQNSYIQCPIKDHSSQINRICTFLQCKEQVKTICEECLHKNLHTHGILQKSHQIKLIDYYQQLQVKLNQQIQELENHQNSIIQSIKTLEVLRQSQESIILQFKEIQTKIEQNNLNHQEINISLNNYHNIKSLQVIANQNKIQQVSDILHGNKELRKTLDMTLNSRLSLTSTNQIQPQNTQQFQFDSVNAVAICREKTFIAIGDDRYLKILNLKLNQISQVFDLGEQINCLQYSQKENQLLIGFRNGQIGLYTYIGLQFSEKQRFNYTKIPISKVTFVSSDRICSINQNGQLDIINLNETNIKNQVQTNIEFNQKPTLKPICNLHSCNLRKVLIASKGGFLLCQQFDKTDNYIIRQIQDENIGLIQINLQYVICSGLKKNQLYFYELNKDLIEPQLKLDLKMILQFENIILSFYFSSGLNTQLFIDQQDKIKVFELDKFKLNAKYEKDVMKSDERYNTIQPTMLDYILVTREKQLIIFKR